MTTATQKQLDYINSMIDSIEAAPHFAKLEVEMEKYQGSDDWQDQAKFQMFEGQVMEWHASLLGIRLRRNPMTLAELKAQTAGRITALRSQIANDLTTVEASQMIDNLKNQKLV